MKKAKYKKPNCFIYGIFRLVSKFLSRFMFKVKVTKNEVRGKKGPYVIIANHEASIDFIALAAAVKRRINFVISNSFYQSLNVQPFLRACAVIPKQQFQTKTSDLKSMKRVVENGGILGIYPAGLMSENGVSTAIPKASGKLLKWLDSDVYVAYISGTYLTSPKWSNVRRKGKVKLSITKLLSAEEIKEADVDYISKLVDERLMYNAYKTQDKERIVYKQGDNVEGLENVLYKCPKCGSEFSIETKNETTLECKACGNEAKSDKYGFLEKVKESDVIYKYPNEWYDYIQETVLEEVKKNPDFFMESYAKIKMIDYKKHKFVFVGDANIKLDKDKFTIDGNIKGEKINKEVSIATFPMLPFKPGVHFEIQDGMDIYRVMLDNSKEVMKWVMSLKALFVLYHDK